MKKLTVVNTMMISIDVEYLYILPAIRRHIAKRLLERGYKQKDVAKIMGFTPAAINQYLKNKRASKVNFNKKEIKIIDKYIDDLITKKLSLPAIIKKIITEFEDEGCVCRIHRKIEKITRDCSKEGCLSNDHKNKKESN